MAAEFFRISDKGSIKRPTILALGNFGFFAIVAAYFLYNHPAWCIFIAWPALYFFFAVVFASPFRIFLQYVMHITRWHTITSKPTVADALWCEALLPLFDRTGLKIYSGEPVPAPPAPRPPDVKS